MISNQFRKDLKNSIEVAWILYSLIIIGVLGLAFFLPETLMNIAPACISKSQFGTECFMCGMTRAFVEISNGNIYNAGILNSISIYLFILLALNSIIFFYYLFGKFRSIRKIKKSFSYL